MTNVYLNKMRTVTHFYLKKKKKKIEKKKWKRKKGIRGANNKNTFITKIIFI